MIKNDVLKEYLEEYKRLGDEFFKKSPPKCQFCGFDNLSKPELINEGTRFPFSFEICPKCHSRFTVDICCELEDPTELDESISEIKILHNYLINYHCTDYRLPAMFDTLSANYKDKDGTDICHLIFWKTKKAGQPRKYHPFRRSTTAERVKRHREKEKKEAFDTFIDEVKKRPSTEAIPLCICGEPLIGWQETDSEKIELESFERKECVCGALQSVEGDATDFYDTVVQEDYDFIYFLNYNPHKNRIILERNVESFSLVACVVRKKDSRVSQQE